MSRRSRNFRLSLIAILGVTLAGVAIGAGQDAVLDRQQNFKRMGAVQKAIVDESKKSTPDFAVITAQADKLKALSLQLPRWFPKGSAPGTGRKTAAKPEIWSKSAAFATSSKKFQFAAAALSTAARSRDTAKVKLALRAVSGTCRECHTDFRTPD